MALLDWLRKKPHELFPGTVKPTTTVAHMLVAEMFQNLGKPLQSYDGLQFPSFSLNLSYVNTENGRKYYVTCAKVQKFPHIVFDDDELKIFTKALQKYDQLGEAKRQAEKEGRSQQAAVNFLASFCEPKKEEVSHEDEGKRDQVSRQVSKLRASEAKELLSWDHPLHPVD